MVFKKSFISIMYLRNEFQHSNAINPGLAALWEEDNDNLSDMSYFNKSASQHRNFSYDQLFQRDKLQVGTTCDECI